jgi:signal transduction histidine kinase
MGGVLPISVSARVTALRSPKGALVATSRLALEVDAAEFLGFDQAVEEVPVEFAEIAVSDTGIGIAPEDQEAVFEEFRQVGTAEKKAEGTGLGLALARKFIELHGGRIWVKSQVGKGSTFRFTLPMS